MASDWDYSRLSHPGGQLVQSEGFIPEPDTHGPNPDPAIPGWGRTVAGQAGRGSQTPDCLPGNPNGNGFSDGAQIMMRATDSAAPTVVRIVADCRMD